MDSGSIMAPLSVEERLGLPERLQMEVTRGFWTKESLEAFDGHTGDVLEYLGEQLCAMRVESWADGFVEVLGQRIEAGSQTA